MEHASELTMERLVEAVERLGAHDHLCLIYRTREEQFAAVIPFMRIGLERGEKCVYIADDNTASAVMDAMRSGGIDVDSTIKSGALAILDKRESYLKQGHFDPDWMIRFLKDASEMAKAEGYACLRVTGEMTWILGGDPGVERLIEYEAKLNYLLPNIDALAICQYNINRFKPEIIIDVIRTHPQVIYGNLVCKNFYYVPPDEFLKPGQPSHEVERLLENILDRERKEIELQNSEAELRKLNEELELRVMERTARMEASNQELESFAYSVSHDLRVPLRAIDGFSNLVLKQYGDNLDDEGRRLLNVVRDNTGRMGRMIDDILIFSRMGRLAMAASEVNMENLARAALGDLAPNLAERDVKVEIGRLPPAHGDLAMLRQVWINLLSNAVKFTRPKPAARIEVEGKIAGTECVYCIKDNGVGFDMQYADKLFGVFQRLHGVEEFDGTGIGLAIVKRIITRHGGRVWAEGKVNEGAAFYFALPV